GLYRIAIKTRASFDGGNSWSTVNTLPHFGIGFGSADVSMAFDKNGLLFISYIDYKQAPDSGGIYVARSFNGGLDWDTPSKAFDMYDVANKRPIDRPWLVVDNSNTANSGTLYITTKPAPWISPPNRNYFKVSSDSGYTWTTIANVDGGTHLVGNLIPQPMAAPATTQNGNFCAAYPSYVSSQNPLPAYYLASSSDKGQTFNYTTIIAATVAPLDTNLKSAYRLAANPIDSNKMIFLIPNASNGDVDIMALHSNTGGQTWSSLIRVNDDVIANGKDQDMVWAAYNEQGNLVVTWRDRRNSIANGFWNAGYDFYYATSTDNGQTFSANHKLTSQFVAFDSILTQSGNDIMGCVYNNDTLCTVWGDTRDGKMNIYFAKTIVSTNTTVGKYLLDGKESAWNIFPNPTNNQLTVSVSQEIIGKQMTLFDASGKKIIVSVVNKRTMDLETKDLARGIYFLKIDNEVKQFVKD
ncbi:MAG: exo-alpha-sialidase, partial [Bacteroidota bacterium]